jgi:hypothetical protein
VTVRIGNPTTMTNVPSPTEKPVTMAQKLRVARGKPSRT